MKRLRIPLLLAFTLIVFGVWLSKNTYWADVKIPAFPKGEALANPFYAVQRFAEVLGARTAWDRVLTIPPPDSVLVLSDSHWDLSTGRRVALERWVESGGRLVIEGPRMGAPRTFEHWSGIVRKRRPKDTGQAEPSESDRCDRFREERAGAPDASPAAKLYWICDFDEESDLRTNRTQAWALRAAGGVQALRVRVGRGSVTVINALPFQHRNLFDGDHGWLFVAATELRRGDDVHFLSEANHLSLLGLLWLYGRPVVLLAAVIIGLALWRGSVRLGPLAPPSQTARRSLAEQIRGTGLFALRHGDGEALHAACARALDEAAARRVSGYHRLAAKDRAAALATLTGFERDALAAAIYHPGLRQSHELRGTIELLETARRMVMERTRATHGAS